MTSFEVEGLALRDLVETPSEPGRREFVEVPAVRFLLFGEHASFAGADAGAGQLGARGERDLGLLRERAEAHVAYEEGDVQTKGLGGSGPDDELRLDRIVVHERACGQLGGQKLDILPAGQIGEGDPHGRHSPMVSNTGEPITSQRLDVPVVRLLRRTMDVLVQTEIVVASVRLRIRLGEGHDLGLVDPDHILVHIDLGRETMKSLVVVVLADPGVVPIVPTVNPADEVRTLDPAVGKQGTPVVASPEHHRDPVVEADHDQIDSCDESVSRTPIFEVAPGRDFHAGGSESGHLHR